MKDRDSYKYVAETDPLTGLLNKAAIEAADRALYHVKNTGRDNYCIYSSELED